MVASLPQRESGKSSSNISEEAEQTAESGDEGMIAFAAVYAADLVS